MEFFTTTVWVSPFFPMTTFEYQEPDEFLEDYYEDISDYEEDFEHEAEKIDSMNDDLIEEENAIREFLGISNKFGKK